MLKIFQKIVSPFQQNARILANKEKAVIVDPGDNASELLAILKNKKLLCESIIITHSHIDHVGALSELWGLINDYQSFPISVYAHKEGKFMRESIRMLAAHYGLNGFENAPEPTHYLEDGDLVTLLGYQFEVSFTPGHSPDHLVFFLEQGPVKNLSTDLDSEETTDPILLAGDCVFKNSIGRTDLPGGDYNQLINSINSKILTLPENTRILSGHGPNTNLGTEKKNNQFLNC